MAGQTGGTPLDLNKANLRLELLKEGHAFSFFQIVRLLQRFVANDSGRRGSDADFNRRIQVKGNLSLAFPPSDVERVAESGDHDDPHFSITANLLGLYGSSSPLPTFYTEDLIDEESQDESVSRDFIDILNQRLFSLLYRCWTKYRLPLKVLEEGSPQQIEQLFCLLGLGDKSLQESVPSPQRLLRYVGLFTQFPRSALGLKTLLRDALNGIPLEIMPCMYRRAKIPESQTMRMGVSGSSLGADSFIGDYIDDRMGKFRIKLGPLTRYDFQRYTPGHEQFDWLVVLTSMYFVEPLEYDIEIVMAAGEARSAILGDNAAILGVESWIFSADKWGEVSAIFEPTIPSTD